ncbi:MAG: FAD-dependent thymidylate synthase, partial [Planctomycetes bacterium]|nr:FAD-dependent thymidylate synthase [Planctomycetota bacterium]
KRELRDEYVAHSRQALALYQRLTECGVAREQARGVLPLNIYTEFYWTASLQAIVNFIHLRQHPSAQFEIRQYADAVDAFTAKIVPISYRHLLNRSEALV